MHDDPDRLFALMTLSAVYAHALAGVAALDPKPTDAAELPRQACDMAEAHIAELERRWGKLPSFADEPPA